MPRHTLAIGLVVLCLTPLFLPSTADGIDGSANEMNRDVRTIAAKLLKESRDEEIGVKEEDRWPHFDDCFGQVTQVIDGHRAPIDWTDEDGFIALEKQELPDHTQRAAFMRRVGEVVERWAEKQGRSHHSKTYVLAATQWNRVLEYIQWEEDAADDERKSTVRMELRKLRDLASYHEIFCKATASRGPGATPPAVDELTEFVKLPIENIGVVVLRAWRKLLTSRFQFRNAAEVVKANDDKAKGYWRNLLDATEAYRSEVEKYPKNLTPLKESEIRQLRTDRTSLPRSTP